VHGTVPLHSRVTVIGNSSCTLRSLLSKRNSTYDADGTVFGTTMAKDKASTTTGSE
jgi:hypothetical protein